MSFSGAGLSAESGIATFRDKLDEGALWSKFDPQELASQAGFRAAPEMVIDWYNWRRKTLSVAKPNNAHLSLARLQGWTHITQNVDNLLEKAQQAVGVNHSQVLHLHGTLLEDHCNAKCGYFETVELSNAPTLRQCACGDYMRPSVIWFGEALPAQILQTAQRAAEKADLMLVIGTSAQVYPAASLVDIALRNGSTLIVVNTEASSVHAEHVIELVGPAGEILPRLIQGIPTTNNIIQ
ncbi:MAG: Sir2 family NAD-dependent protein deacetylase [Granulosicoccus sp.]